jgi:tetratricopeptide (TPR) repeat protein
MNYYSPLKFETQTISSLLDARPIFIMNKVQQLLNDLKNTDPAIRNHATHELWQTWYKEAGRLAEDQLDQGTRLMGENLLDEASKVFKSLINNYPDFAEAYNKLATLLFMQRDYAEAIFECERTLKLNPHHFGAMNGMGMCLYQLARYDEALTSFQRALKIQPYADINREYVARCRGLLN